jgi:hypothetical protein
MRASADAHVDSLAAHLGRPLSLGTEGTLELSFDDGLSITLELTTDETLYLYSVMGPAPVDANALRALLETQFFGRIADHVRFAIDPDSGELLLMEKVDLTKVAPHEMPQVLTAFMGEVKRQRAAEPRLESGHASDSLRVDGRHERSDAGNPDHSGALFPGMRV